MDAEPKSFLPPFRIREVDPKNDEACILATWLNSFEPHRDRRVPRDLYYRFQHERIEQRLWRASGLGTALVACFKDDPTQIMGWLVGQPDHSNTLDYVFTKSIYRRFGIATALLKQFGKVSTFTHYTDAVPYLKLAALLPAEATYNPYRLP